MRLVALGTGRGTPRPTPVRYWRPPRTGVLGGVRDIPHGARIPQIQRSSERAIRPAPTPPRAARATDTQSTREVGRRWPDGEGGSSPEGREVARRRGRRGGAAVVDKGRRTPAPALLLVLRRDGDEGCPCSSTSRRPPCSSTSRMRIRRRRRRGVVAGCDTPGF
jgi:general stress protein YciG